eukprot:scaffold36612_cov56-Phaeocystis_antarctica.AAC.3
MPEDIAHLVLAKRREPRRFAVRGAVLLRLATHGGTHGATHDATHDATQSATNSPRELVNVGERHLSARGGWVGWVPSAGPSARRSAEPRSILAPSLAPRR